MEPAGRETEMQPRIESLYGILRAMVRVWLGAACGKVRVLRAEPLLGSGPVIAVVSHPPGFLNALILVAAFKRQVHCLLSPDRMAGFWPALIARRLGMIPCEVSGAGRQAALQEAGEVLERHGMVAVFADPPMEKAGGPLPMAATAAALMLHVAPRLSNVSVFPVHLSLPAGRKRGGEVVLFTDAPLSLAEHTGQREGDAGTRLRKLAGAIEESFQGNAFRLHEEEIRNLLADLEEILRTDLQEDWAGKPNWKQNTEDFKLSEFVADWVDHLNSLNPGRLVSWREELASYREARRRCAQRRFELEGAAWLESLPRRLWLWLESAAGLPVALYGLINHLPAGAALFWGGLLKEGSESDSKVRWGWRALVVLGFYGAQILLCDHLLGRAAAGYYALTLPASGAYLWRYRWLVRNRTRLLLVSAGLGRSAEKLARARKRFMEDLNSARDAYAEAMGIPR